MAKEEEDCDRRRAYTLSLYTFKRFVLWVEMCVFSEELNGARLRGLSRVCVCVCMCVGMREVKESHTVGMAT